jgi:antitoxin (DNA-binding transcriptional repressor) of toxin-antitoxin stability system
MIQITLDDATKRLPDLVDAAVRGEEVLITVEDTQGKHLVRLVPVILEHPRPRFGSARGLFDMSDDFDAPLPDFDEYQ